MTAGIYNFIVEQGATFTRVLTWKDANDAAIDLTGYTARLKARTSISASSAFIDLTTENGGIALGGAAGTITLTMSDTVTAAITERSGVYDLELIDGSGTVTRLVQGSVTVSFEVTT